MRFLGLEMGEFAGFIWGEMGVVTPRTRPCDEESEASADVLLRCSNCASAKADKVSMCCGGRMSIFGKTKQRAGLVWQGGIDAVKMGHEQAARN